MKSISNILWAVSLSLFMISSGFVIVGSGSPESIPEPESIELPSTALFDPWPTWTGNTVYHTFEELETELFQAAADHPDIMTLQSIGKSWQDRDIWAIKISDNPEIEEADEPEVYFNSNHHAREWLTIEIALYAIHFLTDNYGTNATVTDIVDNRQVWIIPCVNPDGRVFDGNVLGDDPGAFHPGIYGAGWRKNCADNNGDEVFNYLEDGVDPNRNYGYLWGASGATSDPTEETYGGPAPFSEPEMQAIRDFARQHDFVYAISYHTYSQLILYPWGWSYQKAPDHDALLGVAYAMDAVITNTVGSAHDSYVPTKSSGLYPTAGSDDDWLYGELGTFAYCVEAFPYYDWVNGTGAENHPAIQSPYNLFHPESYVVLPVCQDNIGAIILLCQAADNRFQFIDHVSSEPVEAELRIEDDTSDSITINITDDGQRDDDFYVNCTTIPGWTIDITPGTMSLARNETQPAILDITVPFGQAPGTYTIWVNTTSQTNSTCTDSSEITIIVPWPFDIEANAIFPFTEMGDFPMAEYNVDGTVKNIGEAQVAAFNSELTISLMDVGSTVTLFDDDMESGMSKWTIIDHDLEYSSSSWQDVTSQSSSGTHSFWCGDGGGYTPESCQSLMMAQPINLKGYTSATLEFMSYYQTEEYYDFLMVEASRDNGESWDYITRYDGGAPPSWQLRSLDFSDYLGSEEFQLRFRFTSDGAIEDIGFWLDDVIITAHNPSESIVFGPAALPTSGLMDVGAQETLTWNYNFTISGPGTYKASLETLYPTDDNSANNIKEVMFYINGSRTLPEFDGVESVFNTGQGTALDIAWDPALNINGPITYHVYRFDHSPSEIEVNSTAAIWSGAALEYQDTGVVKGQIYYYVVRAEDSLGQIDYNMIVMSGIPDMTWYLQIESSVISGYQNLNIDPMDLGDTVATAPIPVPGDYMVGTTSWISEPMDFAMANDGAWTFNIHGYSTSGLLEGNLFAKVYEYNGGAPNLVFTTTVDDEDVGLFASSHEFTWDYVPAAHVFPMGERIIVEIWLDVTTGDAGGSGVLTYVPNDTEFSASFWIVDAMPPTGANLNSETVFDAAMDTQASTSDDSRALSVDPGNNWDEMFTWCDVTVSTDPAAITQIDLTFEGQGNAATDFDLWVLGPGGWAATGDSITLGAGTDGTLTGTITVTPGDYIIGGLLTWGVYQTDSNDLIRVDLLETVITYNVPAPVFIMEYDSLTTPSNVEANLSEALGGLWYDIPIPVAAGADDWVFVSFPYPMSGAIETVLDDSINGGGGTTWDVAKWYNPLNASDPWKTHRVGAATNDLLTIDNTIGVWLHLTATDGTLSTSTIGDYSGANVDIQLYEGWNLVSYPSASPIDADATLPAEADFIAEYNDTLPYLIEDFAVVPGAVTMSEGNAYWVHVSGSNTVWSVAP